MHHGQGPHHKTRCAKTALQGVVLAEALLHDMQVLVIGGHALNCQHRLTSALQCQSVARFDGLVIDQHRAGPALGGVTPLVGAGELALLAQHINQQRRRRHLERDRPVVEMQGQWNGGHAIYFNFKPDRATACRVASRSTSVSCNNGRRTGPPC